MNNSVGDTDAGAGIRGGCIQTAPANFTVGAVGFGPMWTAEDSMAASIIRLEQENQELRAEVALLREQARIITAKRDEARHDATQQTIKVSLIKSRWIAAREALQRLADCDWVITPHDRMDAVRKIARDALEASK